jgi:hypothetical protein
VTRPIIREGGWYESHPADVSSARTMEVEVDRRGADLGFRCANDP